MLKRSPYLIEMTLGAILTGVVAWGVTTHAPILESRSLKTFDLFSKYRRTSFDTSAIQIVEIDENSTKTLGRWPWPRSLQADLIDGVAHGGAKVIGLNVGYQDSDQNEGMETLSEISEDFTQLMAQQRPILKRRGVKSEPFDTFQMTLQEASADMNGDSILARSIDESSNIVLPMFFLPGETSENLDPIPEIFPPEKLQSFTSDAHFPHVPDTSAAELPITAFAKAAVAIGHCNLYPDIDGTVRRLYPVLKYGDRFYPSFAIQLIRQYRSYPKESMTWKQNDGFVLNKTIVPTEETGGTFLQFAGPAGTFKRFSALDVLSNGLPEGTFDKKLVLIGVATTGGSENFVVPGGERMSGLEIWANHLENILSQKFILRPNWATKAEWGMLFLNALVIILALPMMRARFSIPIALVVALACNILCFVFFTKKGWWISPAYANALLFSGFLVIVARRLIFTERGKEIVEAEGTETNKMLGLSFQGQGLLDLAFEKFRKCPVDNSMKELLYNLGLDMERKRQFSKAAAVYEHIAANDPKYKDIKEKIELLKKASDGAIFGPVGKKGSDSTVVVEGLNQATTLGRYEITKELGRGAMGIVYLGKDPKINRQVAIKTLRFEEDMDEAQTKATKERFFREAESAGNLTHPNIIRIFDAGEDQEVAYIAMELLEGSDLKQYCDKAHLLPLEVTLDYVAKIADALDFAHKQGVVHRDIKPGNIMLLKDGTLRITDFGIARIQATSKTATGAVLGTPAYMSPEQVNGKKVDGRADIFSLGVTLYEMLTGEKPFQADSIAALLFRIANVEPPDPREHNSHIPEAVIPIIKKALAKSPEERYQTAGDLANDLRDCMRSLKYGASAEKYKPLNAAAATESKIPPMPSETNGSIVEAPVETTPQENKNDEVDKSSSEKELETLVLESNADSQIEQKTAEKPAEQQPAKEQNFYSELEKTFDVGKSHGVEESQNTADDLDKTIADELGTLLDDDNALPGGEKTLVEEKTIVTSVEEIPLAGGIEHSFHPENLNHKDEPKEQS